MARKKKKEAEPPKRCYICGRKIRFISTNGDERFYKCDFAPDIVARCDNGPAYISSGGVMFRGTKDLPLGTTTVALGYKLHCC